MSAYWKTHYIIEVDPDDVERALTLLDFRSEGARHQLVCFLRDRPSPNILVSQGSGGPAHIFAELAYLMHLQGYNVFIMPKQGGYTIPELMVRHDHALQFIAGRFSDRTGVFAEGLGGYVAFYLALAGAPMRSLALQNAPAILTERQWHEAVLGGSDAGRRRARLLPILRSVSRLLPGLRVPMRLYLDFSELIDTKEGNRAIEERLVDDGYRHDPDFDRWYRLDAIMSLLTAPPPAPLSALAIPTFFMVARRGFIAPDYFHGLYDRLPPIRKEIVELDGSPFWMISHPREAAAMICGWFDRTISRRPLTVRHSAQPDA
jgi:hypothetical protein